MLVKIRALVAQMDQSGRFLNGKSRFDSVREHHFFQPDSHRIPSLKSDTASDTILSFQIKLEPKTTKGQTLKTADGNENQSIESMRKY